LLRTTWCKHLLVTHQRPAHPLSLQESQSMKRTNSKAVAGSKRGLKVKARNARKREKLINHATWLEHMVYAGVEIDMDKLMTKKVFSKYFNREDIVARNQADVKFIIARLVSRNVPYMRKAERAS